VPSISLLFLPYQRCATQGDNGSGKSAVLAAIQICLGANARRTHRARNIKEMVRREGAGSQNGNAKIQVTLLNGGADAYRPELYGETITVQRSISLGSGSNGYSLLDHDRKERSTNKKDLCEMLDHLCVRY
jgi:chromosome segregation ATPase